jgi:hypothetical protein
MRNLRESIAWMKQTDRERYEAAIEDETERYKRRLGKYTC